MLFSSSSHLDGDITQVAAPMMTLNVMLKAQLEAKLSSNSWLHKHTNTLLQLVQAGFSTYLYAFCSCCKVLTALIMVVVVTFGSR